MLRSGKEHFPSDAQGRMKAYSNRDEACSTLRSALLNIGGFSALAFGQSVILVSLQFSVALHFFFTNKLCCYVFFCNSRIHATLCSCEEKTHFLQSSKNEIEIR